MIQRLAKKFVDFQITKGYLGEAERNKYVYAYELTINQSINLFLTFILAVVFGEVHSVTLFLVLYIPLRKYSGGFHADSNEKCILYSAFAIVGVIFANKILMACNYDSRLGLAINCLLMIYVNIMAPIEVNNKKISSIERRKYKRYVHLITLIHMALLVVNGMLIQLKFVHIVIFMTYVLMFLLLIIEQMKRTE